MSSRTIEQKLQLIQQVFDVHSLLTLKPDNKYVQKYYKANQLAYSLFHTKSGIIHMGISRDGIFHEDDLLEAARIIETYIQKLTAKNVLELATGRGGTSIWLAKKYPNTVFHGIDLSPGQLFYARRKAKNLPNYLPEQGDFQNLSSYRDRSVDIVFVIEALCYSKDKFRVLEEVKRVLGSGGVFIILDAYANKDQSKMSEEELLACRLTELGMAVDEFADYPSLLQAARKTGFTVEASEDVSKFILPTLRRFESLAERFFRHSKVAKLITKVTSKELTYNAISGLLMPNLIRDGLASYHITVLRKG